MFFEGFRSERQLMEQVNLNLALRWYIGCDKARAALDARRITAGGSGGGG